MKLNIAERILLGNVLASQEGNFTTLKLVRDVRGALSFKDDEVKKLNFVQVGNQINWNVEAAIEIGEVEIPIGDAVIDIIKKILTNLNDQAKLTEQHFSLYEKFIVDEETNLKVV